MALSGWKRGLVGGILLAILAVFVPSTLLDGPASSVGLEVAAFRALLVAAAFIVGYLIGATLFTRRDFEFDRADDLPLPMAQPAVAAPGVLPADVDLDERLARIENLLGALPAQTTKAIRACPTADLDRTLRSIQRALRKPHSDPALVEAIHSLQQQGPNGLMTRLEALEARVADQLAAIDARLAMLQANEPAPLPMPHLPMRPPPPAVAKRIGRAVADIRRSMDGLPH